MFSQNEISNAINGNEVKFINRFREGIQNLYMLKNMKKGEAH